MVSIARVGLPQTGDVIYKQLLGANTLGTTIALIFRVTWEIPVSGAGRAAESDLGLQMMGVEAHETETYNVYCVLSCS